ncbi:MAG: hypothetical protein Greene041679_530, partial [Parcubacteria group bacterium Greene0416_79]
MSAGRRGENASQCHMLESFATTSSDAADDRRSASERIAENRQKENPLKKKYHQLSSEERFVIEKLYAAKVVIRTIAEFL